MNRFERVDAALRGLPTDRVPVALWRHFPESDQGDANLADAVVAWQRQYDWDLVKVTPTSGYPYEDWGARFSYRGNAEGTRDVLDRPVKSPADWARVAALDVSQGVLGREVRATRLIARELGTQAPILQTLFSPSYTVSGLSGRERFLQDARTHPDLLRPALEAVTQTTIDLARAFLDAGASGIFFATQLAARGLLTVDEYRTLAEPYDRAVLAAVRERADILLLHAHGVDVSFDLLAAYPVDAMNWHDRAAPPSLEEGQRRFAGCVVGGIGEAAFEEGSPQRVTEDVRTAIEATGGRRVIVATGCVVPITAPEACLRAARSAVD